MAVSERYLDLARTLTDLSKYVPGVAKEMREQKIGSLGELWERVEPFVKENPKFFRGVTYTRLNRAVHGRYIFNRASDDYSRTSYALSAVFGKSAEEIFGYIPRPNLSKNLEGQRANLSKKMGGVWDDRPDQHEKRTQGPIAVVHHKEMRAAMHSSLDCLSERHQKVIRGRFGIGEEPKTLEKTGEGLGITRERVRQIEGRALYRLRENGGFRKLHPFLKNL